MSDILAYLCTGANHWSETTWLDAQTIMKCEDTDFLSEIDV